jgi:hypothetical protein
MQRAETCLHLVGRRDARQYRRGRGGNAEVLDQVKPKALRERLLKVWAKW